MEGVECAEGESEAEAAVSCTELRAVVNTEYEPLVLSMLDGAVERIRIVHFECNDDYTVDKVVDAMIAAAKRGVDVRVLLEADVEANEARVEQLNDAGVHAKLDEKARYTHAKLVVVDGRAVLFGSTNFSYKSMLYNNETNLFLDCPEAGAWYEKLAQAWWSDPSETPELAQISVESIGLLKTLRDDTYFDAAHPLVQAATKRVLLLVYGFHMNPRYPDSDVHKMAWALADAKKRGVEVRVILEESDYNRTLDEMNHDAADYLTSQGVDVRFDPPEKISHAKLLVVDDTAIVGSNNWGHGGFHMYHEVGGVTNRAGAVSKLADYFDSVWEKGSPNPSGKKP